MGEGLAALLIWFVEKVVHPTWEYATRFASRAWFQYRVKSISGDKFGILIARLEGDDSSNSLRESIRDSIKKELGDLVEIIVWNTPLALGEGHDSRAARHALDSGLRWLNAKNGDLLIWGRVKSQHILSLRFISTAEALNLGPVSYELTPAIELPLRFVRTLGALVAAQAILNPRHDDFANRYSVSALRDAAAKVKRILDNPPSGLPKKMVVSLGLTYAKLQKILGAQTDSISDVEESVAAYREALRKISKAKEPEIWREVQNNFGNALSALYNISGDIEHIRQSAEAHRKAINAALKAKNPTRWGLRQHNLAAALERLNGADPAKYPLEDALSASENALSVLTPQEERDFWATAQNTLGVILQRIAIRDLSMDRCSQSIDAFELALQVTTEEHSPLAWATTQNNLALSRRLLAELTGEVSHFWTAAALRESILRVHTREVSPFRWAAQQQAIGETYVQAARSDWTGTASRKAQESLQAALTVFPPTRFLGLSATRRSAWHWESKGSGIVIQIY